jgi:predicted nucleic acid-binding protein
MVSEKGVPTETEGEPATAAVPLKVLVDLNVVLDVLQARKPHYETSASIWAAVEEGRLDGSVAAHSVTTLFYLLSRHLSAAEAISAIHDLVAVFSVAKVDDGVILNALSYGWRDFEDAVQMAAAAGVGADFVVTRNPKDFKAGPVAVLEPASLHAILQAS